MRRRYPHGWAPGPVAASHGAWCRIRGTNAKRVGEIGAGPTVGPQRCRGVADRRARTIITRECSHTWTRPPPIRRRAGARSAAEPCSPSSWARRSRPSGPARCPSPSSRTASLERQLDVRHDHPQRHAGDVVQREQHHARRHRQPDASTVIQHGHRRAALRDDVARADNTDSKGLRAQLNLTVQPGTCAAPGRARCTPARSNGAAFGNAGPGRQTPATATSPPAAATACASAGASRSSSDNSYQNAATTATFTFAAEQTANNP